MLTNLFQRYYLWTFLILSGFAGLALGNLATTLVGSSSAPVETASRLQQEADRGPVEQVTLRRYQPIITHNIFNAEQRNIDATPQVTEKAQVANSSDWALIGTLSGGSLPLATLRDKATTATYALGEELPDGAILSAIERNYVELQYPSGKILSLELENSGQEPNANRREAATRSARQQQSPVESLGRNRWEIPARVAEDARGNIGDILKQALAVPYLEGGETTGFQLRMVRRNSLIAQLGLKRGDILRKVNGLPLNSPEKALQIFGQLRQAKHISIDLERGGKTMTFAYEIR